MVYFSIGIILFCFTLKGYCGKMISNQARDAGDACLFNFLRMAICILVGTALVLSEGVLHVFMVEPRMLLISLFSGIANASFMISWLFAVKKNSMVSVDVALTLGSIIPSIVCAVFFDEPLSVPKFAGFALILCATCILVKRGEKTEGSVSGVILLIIAMLGDGFIGLSQQLYKQFYTASGTQVGDVKYPNSVFQFYTYLFAAAALLIALVIFRWTEKKRNTAVTEEKRLGSLTLRAVIYIAIIAVCLFTGNYFQTAASADYGVSSQLLYPIIKGGCLITVNFVAMFCFGEKMTRRTALGMLTALSGMIVMSVL